MKILIAGCGYTGTALAGRALSAGHEVWGLRRDVSALSQIKGLGPIAADLLNPRTLKELPEVDLLVLAQAPARQGSDDDPVYAQGTKNLIAALIGRPPKKIVLISSTGVYAEHQGGSVDESTEPSAGGYQTPEKQARAQALLKAERVVLNCGIPAVVLRCAGIYGPGRGKAPGTPETGVNRIHVEDVVRAVLLLFEKGKAGEIYIGVDENQASSLKRCSNAKLKALGFRFGAN